MKKIANNFDKIFLVFLYLQPFLDIIIGISLHFNISSYIFAIIRFLFLFISLFYLIFYIKDKRLNIYLLLLLLYFFSFIITIYFTKGSGFLIGEAKNFFSTFYFIIMLLTLIKLYKEKNFNVKHLYIIFFIYLIFVFIPNIFNLGFESYDDVKTGMVGFFASANVVGAFISILLPILIANTKKFNFKYLILAILYIYVVVSLGTKVPILSLFIIIVTNIYYYFVKLIKNRSYKPLLLISLLTIILIVGSVFLIPKTSFYKNIVIHINYVEKNKDTKIDTMINNIIFSERLTFLKRTNNIYKNSNISEKLFGIGYINSNYKDYKTIEIDYFDIFYRQGIVGFILFFIPLLYYLFVIFKNKRVLSFKTLNVSISLFLILILAFFQGHVFVTPAISIYVALVISLIYNRKEGFN